MSICKSGGILIAKWGTGLELIGYRCATGLELSGFWSAYGDVIIGRLRPTLSIIVF